MSFNTGSEWFVPGQPKVPVYNCTRGLFYKKLKNSAKINLEPYASSVAVIMHLEYNAPCISTCTAVLGESLTKSHVIKHSLFVILRIL